MDIKIKLKTVFFSIMSVISLVMSLLLSVNTVYADDRIPANDTILPDGTYTLGSVSLGGYADGGGDGCLLLNITLVEVPGTFVARCQTPGFPSGYNYYQANHPTVIVTVVNGVGHFKIPGSSYYIKTGRTDPHQDFAFTVHGEINDAEAMVPPPPPTGTIKVAKGSSKPQFNTGNKKYGTSAEFTIQTLSGNFSGTATINGSTVDAIDVLSGPCTITEVSAPEGFTNAETINDSVPEYSEKTVTVNNQPLRQPVKFMFAKNDIELATIASDTKGHLTDEPQGDGEFKSTWYKIALFDNGTVENNKAIIPNRNTDEVFSFEISTVATKDYPNGVIDFSLAECRNSVRNWKSRTGYKFNDYLNVDGTGVFSFPLGIIEVQEIEAPEGYLMDDDKTFFTLDDIEVAGNNFAIEINSKNVQNWAADDEYGQTTVKRPTFAIKDAKSGAQIDITPHINDETAAKEISIVPFDDGYKVVSSDFEYIRDVKDENGNIIHKAGDTVVQSYESGKITVPVYEESNFKIKVGGRKASHEAAAEEVLGNGEALIYITEVNKTATVLNYDPDTVWPDALREHLINNGYNAKLEDISREQVKALEGISFNWAKDVLNLDMNDPDNYEMLFYGVASATVETSEKRDSYFIRYNDNDNYSVFGISKYDYYAYASSADNYKNSISELKAASTADSNFSGTYESAEARYLSQTGKGWTVYKPATDEVIVEKSNTTIETKLKADKPYLLYWAITAGYTSDNNEKVIWQIVASEISQGLYDYISTEHVMAVSKASPTQVGERALVPADISGNEAATIDDIYIIRGYSSKIHGEGNSYEGVSTQNHCLKIYPKNVQCYEQVIRGGVAIEKWDLEYNRSLANGAADHSNISKDNKYQGTHLDGINFNIFNLSERYIIYNNTVIEPGELVTTITTAWDEDRQAYVAKTGEKDLPYGTYSIREATRDTNSTYNATDVDARIFQITRDGEMVDHGFNVTGDTKNAAALGANHDKNGTDTKVPLIVKNFVARGDFRFVKTGEDDSSRISTLWVITNNTTGERHVVYTDEAGYYQSYGEFDENGVYVDGGFPDHNTNTNALDELLPKIDSGEVLKMKPESLGGDIPDKFFNINIDTGEYTLNKLAIGGLWFSKSEEMPNGNRLYTTYSENKIKQVELPEGDVPIGTITGLPHNFGWASSKTEEDNVRTGRSYDALTLGNTVDVAYALNIWTDASTTSATEHEFGALTKGYYTLTEVATDTNFLYDEKDFEFKITRQNQFLEVGTIDDMLVPVEPEIRTTATNGDTSVKLDYTDGESIIIDTVYYAGLNKETEYEMRASLYDATTSGFVFDTEKLTPVIGSTTFTTGRTHDGNVRVELKFTNPSVIGHKLVVFEELFYRGEKIGSHEDPEDIGQTLYYPELKSLTKNKVTVPASGSVDISDKVDYSNLYTDGTSYYLMTGIVGTNGMPLSDEMLELLRSTNAVRGKYSKNLDVSANEQLVSVLSFEAPKYKNYEYSIIVVDKATGKTLLNEKAGYAKETLSGQAKNFMPKKDGKNFEIDTTGSAGNTLEVTEKIYSVDNSGKFSIIRNPDGKVDVKVESKLKDIKGTKTLSTGATYTVNYTFGIDGGAGLRTGSFDIAYTGTDTPYVLTIPDVGELTGNTYRLSLSIADTTFTGELASESLAYELLADRKTEIAVSPVMAGIYNSSGLPVIEQAKSEQVTNRVFVTGLVPGNEYTVTSTMTDVLGNSWDESETFTAETSGQYVDVIFNRINTAMTNKLTAFTTITGEAVVLNILNEAAVGTIPGGVYVQKNPVTTAETGSITPVFNLNLKNVNSDFVFVNRLYAMSGADKALVSTHDSLTNKDETFNVSDGDGKKPAPTPSGPAPEYKPGGDTPSESGPTPSAPDKYFRTTAANTAGTKVLAPGQKKATIVDRVEYRGYGTGGTTYIMKGVLYNKANAQPYVDATGKNVVVEMPFIPKSDSGTVDMVFTFNGSNLKAGDSLVVYEYMYSADKTNLIAQHTDINDKGQTITIVGTTLPQTGLVWWVVYLLVAVAFVCSIAGCLFLTKKITVSGKVNAGTIGIIIMIISFLCLAIATGMVVGDMITQKKAGVYAEEILEGFTSVEVKATQNYNTIYSSEGGLLVSEVPPGTPQTTVEVDGVKYNGKITIPCLDMVLPIADEWSYPQLKKTPCRYIGSTYGDNIVLFAHNYAKHFGQIKTLSEGDEVFFTDANGVVNKYTVAVTEVLQPDEVDRMIDAENWDLTLFTCTEGGSARETVRCKRIA